MNSNNNRSDIIPRQMPDTAFINRGGQDKDIREPIDLAGFVNNVELSVNPNITVSATSPAIVCVEGVGNSATSAVHSETFPELSFMTESKRT